MTTGAIIRLVLQALVFLAWAFMMYRMLFTLRARNQEQTGQTFAGPAGFLTQFKHWLKSEEDRQDRKTLFFLTFVLIAMNVMNLLGTSA
ncbi:hypothetical protein [Gymnodinialimonas ulvae]|uniref:hypothetical protein n=1 Tax=Gymnodinialimonas ulvae TaxID=3126504 RepID=UPI0030A4CAF2